MITIEEIRQSGLKASIINAQILIINYYQTELERICENSKRDNIEIQSDIENLIKSTLELINKDYTNSDYELIFNWNKNELLLTLEYKCSVEELDKFYKFGEYSSFYAVNCYNGYQDLVDDLIEYMLNKY